MISTNKTLSIRPYISYASENDVSQSFGDLSEVGHELAAHDGPILEPDLADSYRALSSIINVDPQEVAELKEAANVPGLSPETLQAWADMAVVSAFISEPGIAGTMGPLLVSYSQGQE